MNHAARIIERLVIDREPRMLGLAEHAHQLVDGDRVVDGDDVGPRHHHVRDRELAESEDAPEHVALLAAQRIALAAGQRILDQLAQVRLLAETESRKQALEPGRLLLCRTLFLLGKIVFGRRGVAHGDTSVVRTSLLSA